MESDNVESTSGVQQQFYTISREAQQEVGRNQEDIQQVIIQASPSSVDHNQGEQVSQTAIQLEHVVHSQPAEGIVEIGGSTLSANMPESANERGSYGEVVVSSDPGGGGQHVYMDASQIDGGMISSASPFCLICADKGSGYHYSVFSCEGCKGFFKRSVQKNLVYQCKENQDCIINKYTRNSCQYCRFQKCLQVGMKREAVREDRTPGGKHRHKRPRSEGMDYGGQATMTTVILPQEACDDDLIQQLVESRPDLVPPSQDVLVDREVPSDPTMMDVNDLMQYGYIELRYIIEWARKVPGFPDLLIEDQMGLLKASFMELNVLRLAYRSMNLNGGVKFADKIILTEEQAINVGWGSELITCTLDFCKRLIDIEMDNTEFCIVNAIVLTYPDAAGIQDRVAVQNLQASILDCLRKYTIQKYPEQPRRYGKMLLRLPSLRTVSAKAADRFLSMSLDGSIKMNALVLEIMS